MLKFGDRVTAPRSLDSEQSVTGIVVGFDPHDEGGWLYDVATEDEGSWWTHKDETVLVPDPRDERIAYLESGLANLQTTIARAEAGHLAESAAQAERVSTLRSQLAVMEMGYSERGDKLRSAEKAHDKAQAIIAALKALVLGVSDAAAAKEQVWMATEHYNAKAGKAREALATFQKLEAE